jgi:hypothetical protein
MQGRKAVQKRYTLADSSGQASWELLESQPPINNEIIESILRAQTPK